jgi:hypothetical protein
MFRRTATVITVALLALTTGARAACAAATLSTATAAAVVVATDTWGPACGGAPVSIQWGDTGSPTALAWAAWTDGTGRYLGYAGTTDQRTDCRIMIDAGYARGYRSFGWTNWPWYCTTIVHEYGHLTGHEHSLDPTDVMFFQQNTAFGPCVAASRAAHYASPSHVYQWARGRAMARRIAASS